MIGSGLMALYGITKIGHTGNRRGEWEVAQSAHICLRYAAKSGTRTGMTLFLSFHYVAKVMFAHSLVSQNGDLLCICAGSFD